MQEEDRDKIAVRNLQKRDVGASSVHPEGPLMR